MTQQQAPQQQQLPMAPAMAGAQGTTPCRAGCLVAAAAASRVQRRKVSLGGWGGLLRTGDRGLADTLNSTPQ